MHNPGVSEPAWPVRGTPAPPARGNRSVRGWARTAVPFVLFAALVATGTPAAQPPARAVTLSAWAQRIETLIAGRPVSVAVSNDGRALYRHLATTPRIPASVQKILMAMPLLDEVGADTRIATEALGVIEQGVLTGDLWIRGGGDPTTAAPQMNQLAKRLVALGLTEVTGSVRGDTSTFSRDWWASGWKTSFPGVEVALPTALTYRANRDDGGRAVSDPERRAAGALTGALVRLGVVVRGSAGAGSAPTELPVLASVESPPLRRLLVNILGMSDNFGAEVLGKKLAAASGAQPATIAAGANAAKSWAADHGVVIASYDASGLSYSNRVTSAGLVRLLGIAETTDWGQALLVALPAGGEGTLKNRLNDVAVRAKTGTVSSVSTLAGWVWSPRRDAWVEFAILSQGLSKSAAVLLEDQIVRILAASA